MLRGILKTRSVDINNFQTIIDPLFLTLFFCIINSHKIIGINTFLIFLFSLTILNLNNLYDSYRIKDLNKLLPKIISSSALISILHFLLLPYKSSLTRNDLLIFSCVIFIYLFLHHYILRILLRYLRSKGFNTRNAVFFGNKYSFQNFNNQLKKYPWIGYKIIYWFSPNEEDYKVKENKSLNYICDGDVNSLIEIVNSNHNIDNLFFCHNEKDQISFRNILKTLGDFCIPVSYFIDWEINSISLKKEFFGDLVGLNIWNPGIQL